MSSSDESEDSNSARLREAVDTQFINDEMFASTSASSPKKSQSNNNKNKTSEALNQPSLRTHSNNDDQFDMLGVTPQFQQHVAKHLSKLLEDRLQKQLTSNINIVSDPPRKRKKGGIRLFRDSKKFVKVHQKETVTVRKHVESDSDNETKCSEVSVNPDDILNKKDVEKWSNRSKAPVFRYKSEKGTLTSLD